MCNGRLAAARRPDDTERLTGTDREGNALDRLFSGKPRIGKRYVIKPQFGVTYGQVRRTDTVADCGFDVENLEHARARHRRAGKAVNHQPNLTHRHLQHGHENQELGEFAYRDLTM